MKKIIAGTLIASTIITSSAQTVEACEAAVMEEVVKVTAGTPFKVCNIVVVLVFVLMVHFWKIVHIRYKCFGHKTMYTQMLPLSAHP